MFKAKMVVIVDCDDDLDIEKYIKAEDAHLLLHSNKLGTTIGRVCLADNAPQDAYARGSPNHTSGHPFWYTHQVTTASTITITSAPNITSNIANNHIISIQESNNRCLNRHYCFCGINKQV